MVDRERVSAHFRRSISTYDRDAVVQREVGEHLVSLLAGHGRICSQRVLEIGCCTGSMTELLCDEMNVSSLWLNDLVSECALHATERVKGRVGAVQPVAGDIESIELPSRLDLIVSSSTFQWVEHLTTCFERLASALRPEGYLVFSMFGKGTMQQIRDLLGIGLCYVDENEVRAMLEPVFHIERLETTNYRIHFSSPREILRHIQKTGVGGVTDFRWTPSRLRWFEQQYRKRYENGAGVPVDYCSITVVARKKGRVR